MKLIVAIIKAYIVLSCAVLEVAVVIGFFSTSPKTISDFFTFIIFIIICSAMIYWILRIKKPKKTNIPMKQVLNNSNIDYFTLQADGNIGVFNDCLNLVQKTKKIDTFFMRYDLGLQKIVTLKEAIKAKTISIPNINEMENNFVDIAQSRKKVC